MAASADRPYARGWLLLAACILAPACAAHPEHHGRELYAQHGCAVCHGATGHGDGPAAKRLDAAPRDFAASGNYRQGVATDDIARSIRNGGGAMPAFRDLTEAEARDIAAWIGTLQQQAGKLSVGAVTVRDAWVRESTAARTTSSAYFTIHNGGDMVVKLVKIGVAGVQHAQLHEMADQGGNPVMRRVDAVNIPVGATVELAPGGTHVMLTEIAAPLQSGTTVEMTLTFDSGRATTVQAVVRPLSATSAR